MSTVSPIWLLTHSPDGIPVRPTIGKLLLSLTIPISFLDNVLLLQPRELGTYAAADSAKVSNEQRIKHQYIASLVLLDEACSLMIMRSSPASYRYYAQKVWPYCKGVHVGVNTAAQRQLHSGCAVLC